MEKKYYRVIEKFKVNGTVHYCVRAGRNVCTMTELEYNRIIAVERLHGKSKKNRMVA